MSKKRKYLDEIPPSTSDNKETLAQYQARRAAEEQDEYFWKGSRNINEAYRLARPIDDEEREDALRRREFYLDRMHDASNSYAANNNISPVLAAIELSGTPYGDDIEDNDVREYVNAREDMLNYHNRFMTKEEFLAACMATATSNHPYRGHFVTGNQTFAANPGRYGWKRVGLKDIRRGSLVQHLNFDRKPDHAVIIDSISPTGQRFVNYAPGIYPNYKKHKPDWRNEDAELYYNFVGNSADSLRWENEYNEKYGIKKRLGGYTRHSLRNGGIYIKPSHRGRFTALKERTGHSTSWFKENGTPAQKKMATFALNAAKWKY